VISKGRRRYLAAGLRRFGQLALGAVILVAVISSVMGLVFGHPLVRSITVGFYLAGAVLVIIGFFHAHRGPLRPVGDNPAEGLLGRGPIRQATLAEREEALSASGLFVTLGIVLFLIAVALDSIAHRH
jgi:hypothetical protein